MTHTIFIISSSILIFFRCGRLLVACWSFVGLLVGRFGGRFALFNLPKLPFYNGYNRKLVGRFDGYLVGRFEVLYRRSHLALTQAEFFRPFLSAKHARPCTYFVTEIFARFVVGSKQDVHKYSEGIRVSVPTPLEHLPEDLYVCFVILHRLPFCSKMAGLPQAARSCPLPL